MPLEYSDPIDSVKGQAPEGDEGYSEPYEALKALQSINVIWFICKIYAWSIHPI